MHVGNNEIFLAALSFLGGVYGFITFDLALIIVSPSLLFFFFSP
jgi:hypothetical protein